MIRTILVVFYLALVLILLLPLLFILWLIGKKNPSAKNKTIAWIVKYLLARPILWLAGAHVTVYGQENIPSDHPAVFMGNHRGLFDSVLLYSRFNEPCGFVSKAEIKKIPLVNLWLKSMNCLFVDRDDVRDGLKMILAGIEHLKNGISVCIMPEGTRSKTDEVLPFKEGSMKLATKSGCPIIPVAITGAASLFDDHKPFIRSGNVTLTFGKPINVKEMSRDQQKNMGVHVRGVIVEMLEKGPGYIPESYSFMSSEN